MESLNDFDVWPIIAFVCDRLSSLGRCQPLSPVESIRDRHIGLLFAKIIFINQERRDFSFLCCHFFLQIHLRQGHFHGFKQQHGLQSLQGRKKYFHLIEWVLKMAATYGWTLAVNRMTKILLLPEWHILWWLPPPPPPLFYYSRWKSGLARHCASHILM